MITRKLISKEIQTITQEYSGAEALAIMQEYHLSHLAILSNNELLGVISEEDIWGMHDENNKLESIKENTTLFMPLGKMFLKSLTIWTNANELTTYASKWKIYWLYNL